MSDDEDDEPIPSFDDDAQEAAFWRKKARGLRELLDEAHTSLRDFEMSSKELEEEMDKELAQSNKQLEEANRRIEILTQERDEWKGKYQVSLANRNKDLAEATKELAQLREASDIYRKKLRDMELDNDELENAERMVRSTLEDVENRYNQQMERATLMEQEIIDKLQLEETNQRLKDEIREMSEELNVLREREKHLQEATSTASQSDDMTVGELTTFGRAKNPRTPSDPQSSIHPGSASPANRSMSQTPSRLRASLAPRPSLAHQRTVGRDTESPSFAARQRPTPPSARNTASTQARASTKMARDLHFKIGTLQSKIGSSLQQGSRIPRPSLNLGASVNAGFSTPLRASTATIAAGKTPTAPADGDRLSNIPLPNSSLRKSIGRPSARLSMVRGTNASHSSEDTSNIDANLPRSLTPTCHSARDRRDTSAWLSGKVQAGTRDQDTRPSSVAGTSTVIRDTSPLHFLNTDPQLHTSRPSSRPSFLAKDTVRQAKGVVDNVEKANGVRNLRRASTVSERFTPRRTESNVCRTSAVDEIEIDQSRVVGPETQFRRSAISGSGHRSSPSLSDTPTRRLDRSSVSAYREERAHRTLSGINSAPGPPTVAQTGLKRLIATPTSGSRRGSGTFGASGSGQSRSSSVADQRH